MKLDEEERKRRRKESARKWKEKNREHLLAYAREYNLGYYKENAERIKEQANAYGKANPEVKRRSAAKMRAANPNFNIDLYQSNPEAFKARAMKRWLNWKNATPPWVTDDERYWMRQLVKEAKKISIETGIPHEVDHVFPLTGIRDGEHVSCGLHIPDNLRIIPRAHNKLKMTNLPYYELRILR